MSDTQQVLFKQTVLLLSATDYAIEAKGSESGNEGVSINYLPLGNNADTDSQKGQVPIKANISDRKQWNAIKPYNLPAFVELGMGMGQVKDSRGQTKQTMVPLTMLHLGGADLRAPRDISHYSAAAATSAPAAPAGKTDPAASQLGGSVNGSGRSLATVGAS